MKQFGTKRIAYVCALAMALCASFAAPAYAKPLAYQMGPVAITADLANNGTLYVTENRTYTFEDASHGVRWKLPQGDYQGRTIRPDVISAGVVDDHGASDAFTLASSKQSHTYAVTDAGSTVEVTLYNAAIGEVTYQIRYALPALATRFQDTAELYWKFVSDGWDQTSNDVSCTINLPIPSGEAVVGQENVWAFGHGTLDATCEVTKTGAAYYVPHVAADAYAEARLLFPAAWLPYATAVDDHAHLESALAEETQWAREADAQRMWARILVWGTCVLIVCVALVTLVVAAHTYRRYKALTRPHFQDPYFRDVPSADHPAVLGSLYHGERAGAREMSATFMRLIDQHVLEFLPEDKKHPAFKVNQAQLAQLKDPIDIAFAKQVLQLESAQEFNMHTLEKFAKKEPGQYKEAVDVWIATVKAAGIRRGFYTSDARVKKAPLITWLVLSAITFVGGALLLNFYAVSESTYLVLLLPLAALVLAAITLGKTPERSAEAIELNAQLRALKHWLLDFTKLKEAVPQDVVLWNKLLIIAVILGVSKEVLEQINVSMPALMQDTRWIYYYPFMWGYGPNRLFYTNFANGVYRSYRASMASVASSPFSSHGLGGGFSAGGGGGFGGGGGGGAF